MSPGLTHTTLTRPDLEPLDLEPLDLELLGLELLGLRPGSTEWAGFSVWRLLLSDLLARPGLAAQTRQ